MGSYNVYKILTTVRWRGHSSIALQLVQSYTIKNNNKDIISQCVSFPFQPLFLCHKHYSTADLQKYLMYLHLQKTVSVSANPEKLYAHALALCKNWTEFFNTLIGGKFYSKAQIFFKKKRRKKKEKEELETRCKDSTYLRPMRMSTGLQETQAGSCHLHLIQIWHHRWLNNKQESYLIQISLLKLTTLSITWLNSW